MTRDQDIERVLDQWFTAGPTQMPSRFLDDTLDRIDRAPQHRLALRTRLPVMNPILRFAAAAAVVLAVAGFGVVALTQTGGVGRPPAAGSGDLPASLQATWVSIHPMRTMPSQNGTFPTRLWIAMGPNNVTIPGWSQDVHSSVSLVGSDRLEIRLMNSATYWQCEVGDAGVYKFSLSEDGQDLTLTPVNDDCVARARILGGPWGLQAGDASDPNGKLAPGEHVSASFRPFDQGTSGRFAYTVPAGWGERDCGTPSCVLLERANAPAQVLISVYPDVVPQSVADSCFDAPSIERTPAEIVQRLTTVPALEVTPSTPVEIGGLRGVMVDLSVAQVAQVTCRYPKATYPQTPDILNGPPVSFSLLGTFDGAADVGMGGAGRSRYFLLDHGDGRSLLIAVEADMATWDSVLADAMPIINSFQFTR